MSQSPSSPFLYIISLGICLFSFVQTIKKSWFSPWNFVCLLCGLKQNCSSCRIVMTAIKNALTLEWQGISMKQCEDFREWISSSFDTVIIAQYEYFWFYTEYISRLPNSSIVIKAFGSGHARAAELSAQGLHTQNWSCVFWSGLAVVSGECFAGLEWMLILQQPEMLWAESPQLPSFLMYLPEHTQMPPSDVFPALWGVPQAVQILWFGSTVCSESRTFLCSLGRAQLLLQPLLARSPGEAMPTDHLKTKAFPRAFCDPQESEPGRKCQVTSKVPLLLLNCPQALNSEYVIENLGKLCLTRTRKQLFPWLCVLWTHLLTHSKGTTW